jgi:hypothetical protein
MFSEKFKAKIIFGIIFLIHSIGYSQSDTAKTNRWSLSFSFSRDYDYRIAHAAPNGNSFPNYYQVNVSEQLPKYGWHGSILMSFKTFKWLSFQTGLLIDNQGYKTPDMHDTSFASPISTGYPNNIVQIYTFSYEVNITYIGVPIKTMAELKLNKNISTTIDFGFNYYFLEKENNMLHGSSFSHGNIASSNYNFKNNYSLTEGLGIKFSLKNIGVSIKGNGTYFLSQLFRYSKPENKYYNLNFYSFGVELGLHFKIGRW